MLYAAAAIFLLTYVLISVRRIGRISLEMPAVALFGAALMIGLGVVSPAQAIESVNLNVILLLLGMMLMVAGLEVCGFFDYVSIRVASRSRSGLHFLVLLMITTAVLSALVLNDSIVLLMTPIVIKSCRSLGLNPVPFLVGEAIAANVGSVATEVGNPQNAYIAIQSNIPFVTYSAYMVPITAMCLAIAIPLTWLAFRKEMSKPISRLEQAQSIRQPMMQRRGLAFVLAIMSWAVAAFLLSSPEWLPVIALVGGAVVLLLLPVFAKTTYEGLTKRVDWSILLFFIGLFIVLKGVEVSGLLDVVKGGFDATTGGGGGLWGLSGLTALLSNLISNVPAVLLLSPSVSTSFPASQQVAWLTLAASSTLAGNATILGAAANVIVAQSASSHGVEIKMKDFVKAGLMVTAATLVAATALLWLLTVL